MATKDCFQILQTRLTEDDPLVAKFGALQAFSRMLARYVQIVPDENIKTWHAGSIQDLKDKVHSIYSFCIFTGWSPREL